MRKPSRRGRGIVARVPWRVLAILFSVATLAIGCERKPPPQEARREERGPAGESTHQETPGAAVPADTAPAPRYRSVVIPGTQALLRLASDVGPEGFAAVLRVNRRDIGHVLVGDTLVVPDPMRPLLDLSPFPARIAAADSVPKLLFVSLRVQAVAAYERGRLVFWGPTSTGRQEQPTPPGLYHTNWKARERTSTFNGEWLLRWYINIENAAGLSFHEYALPGYPASHACVRLLEEDAAWLYDWIEQWRLTSDGRTILAQGTPVVVFGEFAFGGRPPWKDLADDPRATALAPAEIDSALASHAALLEAAGADTSARDAPSP